MPIELRPIARRGFLKSSAAALAACGCSAWGAESEAVEIALFSDTHIAADPKTDRGGVVMAEHFKQALGDVRDYAPNAKRLFINGDCAYLKGEAGDYRTLVELLEPARAQGWTVTCALGNHDDREQFHAISSEFPDAESPVDGKHAMIVDVGPVRWFILDSLEEVNATPGSLGEAQRAWLAESLTRHADKPAFITVHHNLDHGKTLKQADVVIDVPKNRIPVPGLTDGADLADLLWSQPHVVAFFCGHTHQWNVVAQDGIHFINLPCVAYPFTPNDPAGWVSCRHEKEQTTLELRSLDPAHPGHGEKVTIPHRRRA